nr:MAG TPA: hypothetical protein [Caudoviricetes sp.]
MTFEKNLIECLCYRLGYLHCITLRISFIQRV